MLLSPLKQTGAAKINNVRVEGVRVVLVCRGYGVGGRRRVGAEV